MRKPVVLVLMLLVILGQIPGFLRAMENKQTARCWFIGFALVLLAHGKRNKWAPNPTTSDFNRTEDEDDNFQE